MHREFPAGPPLAAFSVVDTNDPEKMRHALMSTYASARRFEVMDHDGPFVGRGHDCTIEHTGISYCHYEAPVRLTFNESEFVRQQFGLSGVGRTQIGATSLPVTTEDSSTIPAGAPAVVDFGRGFRQLVVRFNIEALGRKLAALTGVAMGRPLTFEPATDTGTPQIRRLRRTTAFLTRELDLAGATSDQGLIELEQVMMLNLLQASRHSHRHLLELKPAYAAPWQVRRAEEFIVANLDQPLTIEAIASATGSSARSIFKSFQDSRGYSPMAFAKAKRLERAHRILQAPSETTTVTGVALLCGFHNQGHFAHAYRAQFGELPSETLRKSR